MKWVPDTTGRFRWRPYYDQEELDAECERLVAGFLKRRHGEVRLPLSTDDLCVMIEQDASSLDLYADLSREGEDVDGMTEFFPGRKPSVRIARELSLDTTRTGRLRTTLAHEYGHVKFHRFLWDSEAGKTVQSGVLEHIDSERQKYDRFRKRLARRHNLQVVLPPGGTGQVGLAPRRGNDVTVRCRRDLVLDAPLSDWMEWQASYACGAILMPLSCIRNTVGSATTKNGLQGWLPGDSDSARELISSVAVSFDVRHESAKVRLEKLGFLQNARPSSLTPAADPL